MRVIEVTILGVFRGWWFKSPAVKVCVEEWEEIKLENNSRESSKSRPKWFKTFYLLK